MLKITSTQNGKFKELKNLLDVKHRNSSKLYLIEGTRFVKEALSYKDQIVYLIFSESFYPRMSLDFSLVPDNKYILLPDPLFNALSETKTPQGILAVMKKSEVQFDNLFDNENMFVILDNIKDPGNMGTLIRTCNCAGVDRIFTSKGCVDIYNPKVLRSTMGSIFHIPIIKCEDLLSIIQQMKVKGISIYASSLNGSVNLYSIHFKDKICIVIGNEADGVDQEIQDLSDYLVRIPMKGSAESLNAGVAGGIIIYEAIRQKNFF